MHQLYLDGMRLTLLVGSATRTVRTVDRLDSFVLGDTHTALGDGDVCCRLGWYILRCDVCAFYLFIMS